MCTFLIKFINFYAFLGFNLMVVEMVILAKQLYFDIPFRFLRNDRVSVMTCKLREPAHYSNLIYRVIYIFFVYFMHGTRGFCYTYI